MELSGENVAAIWAATALPPGAPVGVVVDGERLAWLPKLLSEQTFDVAALLANKHNILTMAGQLSPACWQTEVRADKFSARADGSVWADDTARAQMIMLLFALNALRTGIDSEQFPVLVIKAEYREWQPYAAEPDPAA